MDILSLILVLTAEVPDDGLSKKMMPIYVKEAEAYSLAVESDPKKILGVKKEPIFEWTNPIRENVQHGVIFLWLRDGRPAALGCIFSAPHGSLRGRKISHEFHALDREKLLVDRPNALNEWKPQAGLARKELPDAGEPAATRTARLAHMRQLAREFTGHEINSQGKRAELRLLPAPLYRYPDAEGGTVDGALFALVNTVGTDPEVLLLIEAHNTGGKTRWEYALGRFSNWDLYLERKGKEIWSSTTSDNNTPLHDPLHTYVAYPDKVVSVDGKLLGRFRTTDTAWWGELVPVNRK